MATTAEQLKKDFNVTGSNLANIDKIAAMGTPKPVVTPQVDASGFKGRSTAPETSKTVPVEPQVFNREALGTNLQETLKTEGIGTKTANKEFINAVAKFKLGRDATADELATGGQFGLGGATVTNVLERFGATDLAPSFGIGIDEVKTPEGTATEVTAVEQPKQMSALERTQELLGGFGDLRTANKTAAQERFGVEVKSQAIADANTRANDASTALANLGITQLREQVDLEEGLQERGRKGAVTANIVNREINDKLKDMTFDQKLDTMIMQNNYNNSLVDVQIAQGNYDRAQELVQDSADTLFENFQFQLNALELEGQIEENEKLSLESQGQFQRDLALQGYVQIKDPANLEGLREEELFRDPVTGNVYKKPMEEVKQFQIDPTTDFKNFQLAGGQEGTGMSFMEWQGKDRAAEEDGEPSEYMQRTTDMTLQTVDELMAQVSGDTTGWGAFFKKKLPGSEARSFATQLDTLKGNIGFGALTAMREASKTGGALGQVSDREIKLLTSTLGGLDQLQSAEDFKTQLAKVRESVERWNKAVQEEGGADDFSW